FDGAADAILASVGQAEAAIGRSRGNEFDATMTDLRVLANLARFHARRARAAVSYNLFGLTGDVRTLDEAIAGERSAIDAWRSIVDAAGDRYTANLAMGACAHDLCGHWRDELPLLERGLADIERQRREAKPSAGTSVHAAPPDGDRLPPTVTADRVETARAGEPLRIT